MCTKKVLEDVVKTATADLGTFPDIVQRGIDTISGEIPFKLKLAITLAELITFTSHLRKSIQLYDGTLVPCNAIVFALSASGTSKDKSLNTLRKSLSIGYEQIETQRNDFARKKAEDMAQLNGEDRSEWQKYYYPPKPLQAGLGTVEGLMHHFADISSNPIGAGSVMTSEIGSDLQTNGAMIDIIKTLAVAYDLGNIPAKIVKSNENQTATVKNLPVNALLFGAQDALLFDNSIKAKFKLVFNTQLARRSLFTFTPEVPAPLKIKSVEELYQLREKERDRVLMAQKALSDLTEHLVENTDQEPMLLTMETQKLFDVYLEYNNIVSEEMSNKFQISKLSRKHKQWLALKLAGTYAILHGESEVTSKMYAYAINTVEYMAPNLAEFEKELVKEPYEQLSDMCRYKAQDGEFFVSLHDLRKMSYIVGAGSSRGKVEELATLANSYDENGRYSYEEGGIKYKEIVQTDVVGVSFKIFDTKQKGDGLKDFMARNSSDGYQFLETNFDELELLLKENAAYCSFAFEGGIRKKENLINGTKFCILDVDKSMLTDEEAHMLLSEYNHYIARTSDPDNEFKFRVLLEFDSVVDVDERLWKALIAEIGEELGLVVDILPQSQIFLSFADRTVLTQLNGQPLKTKFLLEKAALRLKEQPKPASSLPAKEKSKQLDDPRETFGYAFMAEPGERSKTLYRALAHAIDLGAREEYIRGLAVEINESWMERLDADELERTLVIPALRRI